MSVCVPAAVESQALSGRIKHSESFIYESFASESFRDAVRKCSFYAAPLRYNCCCDAVLQPICTSQLLSRRIDFVQPSCTSQLFSRRIDFVQPSYASQPLYRRNDFAAAKQRAVAYRDHYRSTLFQPTEVYSSSTMRSHSVVAMLSTGGRLGRKRVCQPTPCPKHYAACLRATSAMSGCDARFPSLQYYFCF